MKYASTSNPEIISKVNTHLLDTIRSIRLNVGDGLNDDEFTRFLQGTTLPTEAGFGFLSYSEKFVVLSVPKQDLTNWYPERGWITPEKERIAKEIAKKYELSLNEPPDLNYSYVFPQPDSPKLHHHLELSNRRETIIIAHPQYLKICLFGSMPPGLCVAMQRPLLLGPELLYDLSSLYRNASHIARAAQPIVQKKLEPTISRCSSPRLLAAPFCRTGNEALPKNCQGSKSTQRYTIEDIHHRAEAMTPLLKQILDSPISDH
jgi:hypothetical protein